MSQESDRIASLELEISQRITNAEILLRRINEQQTTIDELEVKLRSVTATAETVETSLADQVKQQADQASEIGTTNHTQP